MKSIIRNIVLFFNLILVVGVMPAEAQPPVMPRDYSETVRRTLIADSHALIEYIAKQRSRNEYLNREESQKVAEEMDYMRQILQKILVLLRQQQATDTDDLQVECLYTIAKLAHTLLPSLDFKRLGSLLKARGIGSSDEAVNTKRSFWRNLAYFTVIFREVVGNPEFSGSYNKLAARLGKELLQNILTFDLQQYLRPIVERSISLLSGRDGFLDHYPVQEDALPYLYALANYWRGTRLAREVVSAVESFVANNAPESADKSISKGLRQIQYYYHSKPEEARGKVHIFALLRLIMQIGEAFAEKNLDLAVVDREIYRLYRQIIQEIGSADLRGDQDLTALRSFCIEEQGRKTTSKENLSRFIELSRATSLPEAVRNKIQILEGLLSVGRNIVQIRHFWLHPELNDFQAGYVALVNDDNGLLTQHCEQILQSYRAAQGLLAMLNRVEKDGCLVFGLLREIYLPMSQEPLASRARELGGKIEKLCDNPDNIYRSTGIKEFRKRNRPLQNLKEALENGLYVGDLVAYLNQLRLRARDPRTVRLYEFARQLDQKVAEFLTPLTSNDREELTEKLVEFAEQLQQVVYINRAIYVPDNVDKAEVRKLAELFSDFIKSGAIPLGGAELVLDQLYLVRGMESSIPEVKEVVNTAEEIDNYLLIKLLRLPLKEIGTELKKIGESLTNTRKLKPKQFTKIRGNILQLANRLICNDPSLKVSDLASDISTLGFEAFGTEDASQTKPIIDIWQRVIALTSELERLRDNLLLQCTNLGGILEIEAVFEKQASEEDITRRQAVGRELAGMLLSSDRTVPTVHSALFYDVCLFKQPGVEVYSQAKVLDQAISTELFPLGRRDIPALSTAFDRFPSFGANPEDLYAIYFSMLRESYERLRRELPAASKSDTTLSMEIKQEMALLEYILTCLNQLTFKNRSVWQIRYPARVEASRRWRFLRNSLAHDTVEYEQNFVSLSNIIRCIEDIIAAESTDEEPQSKGKELSQSKKKEKKKEKPPVLLSKRFAGFTAKEVNVFGEDSEIVDVAHDGNCFFGAVADQLLRNEALLKEIKKKHAKLKKQSREYTVSNLSALLRELAVEELREHRELYGEFVPEGEYDDYISRMLRNGEWADGLIIQALANALQVNLAITTDRGENIMITPINGRGMGDLHLGYYTNLHYVSLIIDEKQSGGAKVREKAKSKLRELMEIFGEPVALPEEHRPFLAELAKELKRQGRSSQKDLGQLTEIIAGICSEMRKEEIQNCLVGSSSVSPREVSTTEPLPSGESEPFDQVEPSNQPEQSVDKTTVVQKKKGKAPSKKPAKQQTKQQNKGQKPTEVSSQETKQPERRLEETPSQDVKLEEEPEEEKSAEEQAYEEARKLLEQSMNAQLSISQRIKAGNQAAEGFQRLVKKLKGKKGEEDSEAASIIKKCHKSCAEAYYTIALLHEDSRALDRAASYFEQAANLYDQCGKRRQHLRCIDAWLRALGSQVVKFICSIFLVPIGKELISVEETIAKSTELINRLNSAAKKIACIDEKKTQIRVIADLIFNVCGGIFMRSVVKTGVDQQHVAELYKKIAEGYEKAADLYEKRGMTDNLKTCQRFQGNALTNYADELFRQVLQEIKTNPQYAAELYKKIAESCGKAADLYEKIGMMDKGKKYRQNQGNAIVGYGGCVSALADQKQKTNPLQAIELYKQAAESVDRAADLYEKIGVEENVITCRKDQLNELMKYAGMLCIRATQMEKTNSQQAVGLYKQVVEILGRAVALSEKIGDFERKRKMCLENRGGVLDRAAALSEEIDDIEQKRKRCLKTRGEAFAAYAYILVQQADQEQETKPQHAAELYQQAAEGFGGAVDSFEKKDDGDTAVIYRKRQCGVFLVYSGFLRQQAEQKAGTDPQQAIRLYEQAAKSADRAADLFEQIGDERLAKGARACQDEALSCIAKIVTEERSEEVADVNVTVTLPNGNPLIVPELGAGGSHSIGLPITE